MSSEEAKNIAALRALERVDEGMTLGLGTGSTAAYFIGHLASKCREGLKIQAVATSVASEKMAKEEGIPTVEIEKISHLDLTVDGADEVDPKRQLIKGAGGALVREKIVAAMSKTMVVIVDHSKCVATLGMRSLPVEVIPFAAAATRAHFNDRNLRGAYRLDQGGRPYVTDNGNWIFDIAFDSPPLDPQALHAQLLDIAGVVDTGFFFNLASVVIVGYPDGTTKVIE